MPRIVVEKNVTRRPIVTRAFCAGAIVSCAVGFYGSIALEHTHYSWLALLFMTVGNVACIFGSMMFGFEQRPAPAITLSKPREKHDSDEVQVRVEVDVDGAAQRSTRTVLEHKAGLLETRL